VYNQFCHMLSTIRPFILKGRVGEDFGAITITVDWTGFLDDYRGEVFNGHRLRV
jgi:error-prone DNA polymerase